MPEPKFREGDYVFLRSNREAGLIAEAANLYAGEYWYRVRFGPRTDNVPEDELELQTTEDGAIQTLVQAGRWGRLEAFRRAMALERVENQNQRTIYSYRNQRILFQPHQYKPLLKLLDSPDRRLLIADEVGLGKTIEAGIILAELDARRPLHKVLVVCPSRLREKWRNELNRKFDQDFTVYDRASLLEYARRASENPEKARLRGIISAQTLRSRDLMAEFHSQAGELDLVVFDEAHHARNPATNTADLLRELGDMTDGMILLTATPVHLGMRDVHTLLHALRPAEFKDPVVFETEVERYRGVLQAEAMVRSRQPDQLKQAATCLRGVFVDGVLPGAQDPLALNAIKDLEGPAPSDSRDWVSLERRVQDLHLLSHVITRSRKRDVQEHAPVRQAKVCMCTFTEEESRAYQALVNGSDGKGWFRGPASFGTIQRARQAASCLPAAMAAHNLTLLDEDEASDIPAADMEDSGWQGGSEPEGRATATMPVRDSKYEKLLEILRGIDEHEPKAKVIVFAFFLGTTRYLEERLTRDGYPAVRIAGDVPSDPHDPQRDERGRRTKQFKTDPGTRILVSSEVGSEGLDFQFAHHVVNYDLPWNPMVVEQRIGRVDRFGQKSDFVRIWNLVVEGTVEDRILHKLYDRIGIFKRSIGEIEAILGSTMRELRRDYFMGQLSPEEAEQRYEDAARAIAARDLTLKQLEARVGELWGHEDFIREELRRVDRLGRFVGQRTLVSLIQGWLEARHPSTGPFREQRGTDIVWGVRLTPELKRDILAAPGNAAAVIPQPADGIMWFTTDGAVAFERDDLDLVNITHPLFRAALAGMREQLKPPVARVGQARLLLHGSDEPGLLPGLYFIGVHALDVRGTRARRVLETVAWCVATNSALEADLAERLMHLVTEQGDEWRGDTRAPALGQGTYEAMINTARARYVQLRAKEKGENEARYARRRRTLEAEYARRKQAAESRLRTSRARGRGEGVQRMFAGTMDKIEAEQVKKMAELEGQRQTSLTLSDPLAMCAVEVVRT